MGTEDPGFETDASGARERRRERRLPVRVPVVVVRGDATSEEAVATVISRLGALLLCRSALSEGEEVELRRPRFGLRASARVAAVAGTDAETRLLKYGVEFAERTDFWGLDLEGDADPRSDEA